MSDTVPDPLIADVAKSPDDDLAVSALIDALKGAEPEEAKRVLRRLLKERDRVRDNARRRRQRRATRRAERGGEMEDRVVDEGSVGEMVRRMEEVQRPQRLNPWRICRGCGRTDASVDGDRRCSGCRLLAGARRGYHATL